MTTHAMTVLTHLWNAQDGVRTYQETICSCGFKAHGDAAEAHVRQVVLEALDLEFTVDRPRGTYS